MANTKLITLNPTYRGRNGCYCEAARAIVGKNVMTAPFGKAPVAVATITEVRHEPCRIVFDGGWSVSLRLTAQDADLRKALDPEDDLNLRVRVTDALPDVEAWARSPFPPHRGAMSIGQALAVVREARDKYTAMADLVPVIPARDGGSDATHRAFTSVRPQLPESSRSTYTRGRVRRVTASGRWAADLGHGGSTRPLGEYSSMGEAQTALARAHVEAWDALEAWLREYVAGGWELTRLPLDMAVEDRLYLVDVAAHYGVAPATVRAYRSRGQIPAPDSLEGARNPWWHRATITGWPRPGTGARTDKQTAGVDPVGEATGMVEVLLAVAVARGALDWDTGETIRDAASRLVGDAEGRLERRGLGGQRATASRLWAEVLDGLRWEQRPYGDYAAAYGQGREEIDAALAAAGVERF